MTLDHIHRVDAWLLGRRDVTAAMRALSIEWGHAAGVWLSASTDRVATSASMRGILLAMIREAYGDPAICVRAYCDVAPGHPTRWGLITGTGRRAGGIADAEIDVLVSALEAVA